MRQCSYCHNFTTSTDLCDDCLDKFGVSLAIVSLVAFAVAVAVF